MKKYAIISVFDKTGIEKIGKALFDKGYQILSTGNTAKKLREINIDCIEVSDFTGFPEVFSGRIKTLNPLIFSGILYRRDERSDLDSVNELGIKDIDVVVVNFYPFEQVVKSDVPLSEKIENIDIGGPSLVRAAAKNYQYVSVLTSPSQYNEFINSLNENSINNDLRFKLAAEAFSLTSYYDTAIADFFEEGNQERNHLRINKKLFNSLRYGENPHQNSSVYGNFSDYFDVIHGKELSYNNIIDLTAAVEMVSEFNSGGCVIVKHTNPCGAALSENTSVAYQNALSGDPISAFGGIVAFNREINSETAEALNEIFLEIVAAPSFTEDSLNILMKKKNRRIIKINGNLADGYDFQIKAIPGGYLVQDKDNYRFGNIDPIVVTEKGLTDEMKKELEFAWILTKHTKSNAIVITKNKKLLGAGAGQTSRLDSAKIAVRKAKEFNHDLNGAFAGSDAFFPFPDSLEFLCENGISAVIQPGGSIRDEDSIITANKFNITMVFTGIRNFKH